MTENITIRLETKEDYRAVETLTREAFWNVYRPGCLEHYVLHCYRSREGFVPELDFVLECGGELIGHIMFARSEIQSDDGSRIPIMTFGPISIAPEHQRQGYGAALLTYAMERAKELGAGALAITGNIAFYGTCGFVTGKTMGIRYEADPEAEYFLVKELNPGFLDGVSGCYRDPEGYFVTEDAAEQFDREFPAKERKKLPGQLV